MTFSFQASADIVQSLPKKGKLAGAAKTIGTLLSDSNISTGTTQLWAGELIEQLEGKDEFKTLVEKGFAEAFKDLLGEALPCEAKLEIKVGAFIDGDGRHGTVRENRRTVGEQ